MYEELTRMDGLRRQVIEGDIISVSHKKIDDNGKALGTEIVAKHVVTKETEQLITSVSIGKITGETAEDFGYKSGLIAILGDSLEEHPPIKQAWQEHPEVETC